MRSYRILAIAFCITFVGCSEELPARQPVRFVAVGDIMNHQAQIDSAYDKSCDCYKYDDVFADVKSLITDADYAMANLETTLPGEKSKYSGYPQFGAPDSLVDTLKWAGFDLLTLSNNHTVDKYGEGVIRTKKMVKEKGFDAIGTYVDEDEYARDRIFVKEKGGIRFAFLNYSYGTNGIPYPQTAVVNGLDFHRIREEIALAKKRADAVVVMYHYGTEYRSDPDGYQRYAVEVAFQEGADIVVGGHPHVLQPYETRTMTDRYGETKERLVIWSLGNFVSNQLKRYTDGGMVFYFTVEKNDTQPGLKISNLGYIPVWVYTDRTGASPIFRILPCRDYVTLRTVKSGNPKGSIKVKDKLVTFTAKENPPRKLPQVAYEKLRQFYADTLQVVQELPLVDSADDLK